MTTENQPTSSDPSTAAWSSFARPSGAPVPPEPFAPVDSGWRWGWNWFVGIHYGPIPVGILIGLPILIALRY